VNFLRRGSTPPESEENDLTADDDVDEGDGATTTVVPAVPAKPARQTTSSQAGQSGPNEKQQKATERSSRMDLVRQARKATSAMVDPEPIRGLMVAAFLVAVGLVSYLSKDVQQVSKKVHGKTTIVDQTVTHPETAVLLILLAVAAAVSIYWRRRYVTAVAFMICAAIGIAAPLPSGLSDLMWVTFLAPAGYVLWMLMFRMNKEQKAWIAARRPKETAQTAPQARSNGQAAKSKAPTKSSARATTTSSGRYTPPKSKAKTGRS
jgi:hypothetical protein